MMELIKNIIRLPMINRRVGQYYQKLDEQFISYDEWIKRKEAMYLEQVSLSSQGQISVVEYSECSADPGFTAASGKGITIFTRKKELLTEKAETVYLDYMSVNKDCILCYGDEDEWNSKGTVRLLPWLKPEFSPDLLLEYFYLGNSFAVRNEVLESVQWLGDSNPYKNIYDFVLQLAFLYPGNMRKKIRHVNFVTTRSFCTRYFGRETAYDDVKQKYFSILQNADKTVYQWNGEKLVQNNELAVDSRMTSIIIPSKDHPEVLKTCLQSIKRFSRNEKYEIIVVDNGSSEENRKEYEKLKIKYKFNYIYSPSEFNFSAMCNKGAACAGGNFLLFLNDDIEVRQSKWLHEMKRIACRKHVAAVGAKLCYPDSKMIQHAGITNILLGPVHKLQFLEDCQPCYTRPEFMNRNVIAVTGACLMMRKEVFSACGGFDEELAVAFNDVELCFRLYEEGYYNAVCNEIHLWHHESFSRGNDENRNNQKRLQEERKKLYLKHPELYGRDPFDHPYRNQLILDTNLSLACEYPYPPGNITGEIIKRKSPLKQEWENECLIVSLEFAGSLQKFVAGEKETDSIDPDENELYIQGYAFVLEADSSMFDFKILLISEQGDIYEAQSEKLYRPDLHCNLPEEYYADMNGFGFTLDKNDLPAGKYRLGILAESAISRQRLYRLTEKYLRL